MTIWLALNAVACIGTLLYYLINYAAPSQNIWANYTLAIVADFFPSLLFLIQAASFHAPQSVKKAPLYAMSDRQKEGGVELKTNDSVSENSLVVIDSKIEESK